MKYVKLKSQAHKRQNINITLKNINAKYGTQHNAAEHKNTNNKIKECKTHKTKLQKTQNKKCKPSNKRT